MRRLQVDDAEFIVQLYNEPAFKRFIGDKNLSTREDGAGYIEEVLAETYQAAGFGMFLVEITATGAPIGICGILNRDELALPDLGFGFLERVWGAGLGRGLDPGSSPGLNRLRARRVGIGAARRHKLARKWAFNSLSGEIGIQVREGYSHGGLRRWKQVVCAPTLK